MAAASGGDMSGLLLRDIEIVAAINAGDISLTGLTRDEAGAFPMTGDSAVQASSLDLTVGRIFVPPDDPAQLTDPEPKGETGFRLEPGHTVVVETLEEISLASYMAAFGFPPSRLAKNSILMTNPGHVDPGYSGRLRFTLINMGREAHSLEHATPIVSLLIYKFSDSVQADFATRNPDYQKESSNIALLNRLSPDFASLTRRMEASASGAVAKQLIEFERQTEAAKTSLTDAKQTLKDAEDKFQRSKFWVPALTSLIVAVLTIIGAQGIDLFGFASSDDLASLEDRVIAVEAARDLEAIRLQLKDLEESLAKLIDAPDEGGE